MAGLVLCHRQEVRRCLSSSLEGGVGGADGGCSRWRRSPALPSGTELGVGLGASVGAVSGATVALAPRYVVPLGLATSLPVGLRYGYVSERRRVLE